MSKRPMKKRSPAPHPARFLAGALPSAAALALLLAACSIGNIRHDDCASDTVCAAAFGAGSRCDQGYCTPPAAGSCEKTGPEGRACFACPPKAPEELANACTDAACVPFVATRLTKLTADGGLPPLP